MFTAETLSTRRRTQRMRTCLPAAGEKVPSATTLRSSRLCGYPSIPQLSQACVRDAEVVGYLV